MSQSIHCTLPGSALVGREVAWPTLQATSVGSDAGIIRHDAGCQFENQVLRYFTSGSSLSGIPDTREFCFQLEDNLGSFRGKEWNLGKPFLSRCSSNGDSLALLDRRVLVDSHQDQYRMVDARTNTK